MSNRCQVSADEQSLCIDLAYFMYNLKRRKIQTLQECVYVCV